MPDSLKMTVSFETCRQSSSGELVPSVNKAENTVSEVVLYHRKIQTVCLVLYNN